MASAEKQELGSQGLGDAKDTTLNSGSPGTDSDIEAFDTNIDEKRLLRKIDIHLLPAVAVLYLLSFLDRSNVGNARLEGLTTDLGMTGNQYLTSLTLYFIGYVVFEIPCNIILKRTTPKFWLPTLTLLWGVVATLMGITQNLKGFFAVRFFLGVAESGLFPGVVYYFSMWFKRNERQYRVALFFSMASLAGAFGGILAYGIGFMRGVGGLAGWRWIFILEGLLTVVVASFAYLFVSNYPGTSDFLTPAERTFVVQRLREDSDATEDEAFDWASVRNALRDPKCWLYGLVFHTLSLPLYTLSLFLPSIITALGYTAATAQLLTVPPYALATILTLLLAILSERLQTRAVFIICTSSLGALGYILLLANPDPRHRPALSYAGTFLAAAGIYPSVALGLSWPALNVSGQTKRATATAMQISIGNLGAVLGTQLYRPATMPRYLLGHGFALGYLVANVVVVAVLRSVLVRENARKERLAAADGAGDADVNRGEVEGRRKIEGDERVEWRFSY
ncbi:MFS general substrate transporter [Pseudovirgaria hyperparasitica]|uniref:MFS general substrate transporter n=1 Tax=Pseudovirgaria hyperparasitica TaxID=470096 RepID=A0A6A6VZA6_9PEZI|nr:MFS general substrate transporter [Pseudovirgaria hyperparasitica]KAF2755209.1 MFS general substrate transporter [Pseudovirgaria hyperparasitica]